MTVRARTRRAPDGAGPGPRAVQLVVGAAQRDVQQPAFLGERAGIGRPGDRHEATLEPGDEHDRPLEALGAVERHEIDARRPRRAVAPQRGVEPRDETGDVARAAFGRDDTRGRSSSSVVAVGTDGRRPSSVVVGREIGEVIARTAAGAVALGLAQPVEQRAATGARREASALGDAKRDAAPVERGLEARRLRVGAEQHAMSCHGTPARNARQHASATAAASASSSSYATIVGAAPSPRTASGRVARRGCRRPERGLGESDDRARAAVVAHERDRRAAREHEAEVEERRRVGAREAVDRLGGVADDGEVVAVAEPRAEQAELQRRGVLELVDEQVPEAPALRGRELVVALDRVGAAAEHVVEVEDAALALLGS